jgi:ubiquinol-cytochrome c reductase iron-sulfur subunit
MLESQVAETTTHVAEPTRRDFLYIATGAAAAVGGATLVWPFVQSLAPDAATVAAGAPVEVDLSPIAEGQIVKVFWRGKLIFVRHRTAEEIKAAEDVNVSSLRDPQGEYHGWFCPCHGSVFDTSGRVRGGPAPINLPIPPYTFSSDTKIVIGQEATA